MTMCCACACDTTLALDSDGDDCSAYSKLEQYGSTTKSCGKQDDDDFDSMTMCCDCINNKDSDALAGYDIKAIVISGCLILSIIFIILICWFYNNTEFRECIGTCCEWIC